MNVSVTADGYRERRTGFNVRMDLEPGLQPGAHPRTPTTRSWNVSRYDAIISDGDWLNFTWAGARRCGPVYGVGEVPTGRVLLGMH